MIPSRNLDEDPSSDETGGQRSRSGGNHREIIINGGSAKQSFETNEISTAKYKVTNFLPKFLFDQLSQYANMFFLFVACMQQIPGVSPTGRHTTLFPLLTILIFSAIKEAFEDFRRHLDDHKTNRTMVKALRHTQRGSKREWKDVMWKDVIVGDFLRITSEQFFPADMILLSSSETDRVCYVETSNLDGESNLKVRQAPKDLPICMEIGQLEELAGVVNCENPNRHLYEFSGNMQLERGQGRILTAVNKDALLLRGSKLQNTEWIFGFVIYTGKDSKLMMNSPSPRLKRSTLDRLLNHQMTMMFIVLVIISLVSAIASKVWRARVGRVAWYIPSGTEPSANFAFTFLTFTILYNNLIPISLEIGLEIVRYVQASFINNDLEMYSVETRTAARARTSNLNEELGVVRYIFSDKTGTLTSNSMEFKCCSVGRQTFGSASIGMSRSQVENIIKRGDALAAQMRDFLTVMAVCHTAVTQKDAKTGGITYQAASPDECGLLKGAAKLGFVFKSRRASEIVIEIFGKQEIYEVLNVLDFTSTRKRMSLVVRRPDGRLTLMCKGADSVIYERLAKQNEEALSKCVQAHLDSFASSGLRTLCMASRDLEPREFSEWQSRYAEASAEVIDREAKVSAVADLIEQNLILHGASAIEDRLQEGVPETIADLLRADIKVWVLTGDKQETAINIGYSTRLLESKTELLIVNESTARATRKRIKNHLYAHKEALQQKNNLGLVIDGVSLDYALEKNLSEEFQELSLGVNVVICCRVSPKQKADIVNVVRMKTKSVTLAIGDGANDVAMIQAAHVGVGISGLEGLQAACASDYSISQFRFLRRLLFVHGAWNYTRQCKVITYAFHKNICLYLIGMWFAIHSGWSGQTLFERWTFALYNLLFTGATPVAVGLFDKSCSAEAMMSFPELYRANQKENCLNKRSFWFLMANSVYHSLVLFYISKNMMTQDVAWSNGKDGGYLMLGNMCYTYVVITVCLKAGIEIRAWSWPVHLAIWGSIGCWFLFLIIYSKTWEKQWIPEGAGMSGMATLVLSSKVFWLGCLLAPTAALLFDVTLIAVRRTIWKTLTMAVREFEAQNQERPRSLDNFWSENAIREFKESATRSTTGWT